MRSEQTTKRWASHPISDRTRRPISATMVRAIPKTAPPSSRCPALNLAVVITPYATPRQHLPAPRGHWHHRHKCPLMFLTTRRAHNNSPSRQRLTCAGAIALCLPCPWRGSRDFADVAGVSVPPTRAAHGASSNSYGNPNAKAESEAPWRHGSKLSRTHRNDA